MEPVRNVCWSDSYGGSLMTTRAELEKYAQETLKEFPAHFINLNRILGVANEMITLGYIPEEVFDLAYKRIVYLKARSITNKMFKEAGM